MEINDLIYTDEALSVIDNGTWIEIGDEAPGVEFLVTGLQSASAQKLMREKQATARMKNRGEPLTDEQLAKCTKEVLVESVLKGWKGLVSNGEPVEYSQSLARQWVMSRGGERFTGLVLTAAKRVDSRASDLVESLSKNSQPASDGVSKIQKRAS